MLHWKSRIIVSGLAATLVSLSAFGGFGWQLGLGTSLVEIASQQPRSWSRFARFRTSAPGGTLPVLVPVTLGGLGVFAFAAFALQNRALDPDALGGIALLIVAAALAEAFPVPIELDGVAAGGVSLAAVFIVGAAVLYGWAPAVIVAFVAITFVQLVQRRPMDRLLYNGAVYAASAAAAGIAATQSPELGGVPGLLAAVTAGALAFYVTNVVLIAVVVSRAAGERFFSLVGRSVRVTIIPFSIMASVSLTLTVLWYHSAILSVALVGPLVAVALYQRSVHEALRAMRLALTDPLTGLGNHRHFHERLQRELDEAESRGSTLSLCLVDIDDFKRVNDTLGHPVGRHGARAGRDPAPAGRRGLPPRRRRVRAPPRRESATTRRSAIAESVVGRIADLRLDAGRVADRLRRDRDLPAPRARPERARSARRQRALLVEAEREGPRLRLPGRRARRRRPSPPRRGARPAVPLPRGRRVSPAPWTRATPTRASTRPRSASWPRVSRPGWGSRRTRRSSSAWRAACTTSASSRSPRTSSASPGPLSEAERIVLERHPQIGFRMLDSLGVEPVATWVLHHHERWDGAGYPNRLAGDAIPLGARILFVADAYDAMTTDRVYRGRLSDAAALRELERCAGTQFDPEVVSALKAELAESAHPQLEAVAV